jgi:hypothetical protein
MRKGHRAALFGAFGLIVVGCGAFTDAPTDPAANLVGWWKFDEGLGNVAADASDHRNTATIVNGAWGTGHSGGALSMHGVNDGIVTVPLSDSLRSTTQEITLMAWTYRDAQHNVAVVSHGYPTLFFGFHGAQFKWQLELANGRGAECYADPKYEAALGRWIHVAATYDGWVAKLYADGVEVCRKWTWGDIEVPDVPFTMSGYIDDAGRIVDEITGRLDDVRIYNVALSKKQIRQIAGLTD